MIQCQADLAMTRSRHVPLTITQIMAVTILIGAHQDNIVVVAAGLALVQGQVPLSGSDSDPDVVYEATSGERSKEKYVRFEAVSIAKKTQWSLSKEQTSYVEKQFCEFVQDSTLEEDIISKSPVPENVKAFNAPKVDNYLGDIFKSTNRPLDLQADESLRKAQQRLLSTICKVWTIVDNIRSGKSDSTAVGTHKMLHLIE